MSFRLVYIVIFLSRAVGSGASACNGDPFINYTCPAKGGFYCELAESLSSNVIIRCLNGCPVPSNCNDNLFCYPPGTGLKQGALCYQDSPTAGNAQCTFNCVNVTQVDGHVFYPLGCVSSILNTYTPWLAECSSIGTNGSTLPLPTGIIHSRTSSLAAKTTSSGNAGASTSAASAGSSAQSPAATAASNGAHRVVSRISLRTSPLLLAVLLLALQGC